MKIVEDLTIDDLISMGQGNEPVYTPIEVDFLSTYAPHSFLGKPWNDYLFNENVRIELSQALFDIAVKLDNSVYRSMGQDNVLKLIREKAEILQDIRVNENSALMFDIIRVLGNGFSHILGMASESESGTESGTKLETGLEAELAHVLYFIKFSSLHTLKLITPSQDIKLDQTIEFIHRSSESDRASSDQYYPWDKFQNEKKELIELFGDVPIMVYGSALTKENPSDIDTAVFPQEISKKTYLKIMGKFNKSRKVPLSFVIIPQEYILAFALSDPSKKFRREKSVIINGALDLPVISDEYYNKLGIYNAASGYYSVRTALTPEGLALCEGILPRINNRLKAIKFFYNEVLSSMPPDIKTLKTRLPEPRIIQFQSLPTREEFVAALADANMQMYELLKVYAQAMK